MKDVRPSDFCVTTDVALGQKVWRPLGYTIIGGSRIFTRGLKDEFIRMCTDCIGVKTTSDQVTFFKKYG